MKKSTTSKPATQEDGSNTLEEHTHWQWPLLAMEQAQPSPNDRDMILRLRPGTDEWKMVKMIMAHLPQTTSTKVIRIMLRWSYEAFCKMMKERQER